MRRLSIKARIVLWFTGFMVVIALLGMAYLISFSGQLSQKQMREHLKDVVNDTVAGTRFRYGELQNDEMDFYRNGVSVFVYDDKGRLLAPKGSQGIQIDALLEDDTVKRVQEGGDQWLVYDLYGMEDTAGFWVRGVVLESGVVANLKGILWMALISLPLLLLAAFLGGFMITKKAFAAVGEIARTASAITSGQDLSLRIPDDGSGDELSRMSQTVNGMLTRLQQSFETEKQFVSDVSHELRTPTAVMISQCEYALASEVEEERAAGLQVCLTQAKRMSAIISQMLLLARTENGKFQPEQEELDFTTLCEMVAEEIREDAEHAGLSFTDRIEEGIRVKGDEVLLIQMLTNLLTNAVRYNRMGGGIVFAVRKETEVCLMEIRDTGIGMEQETLEKIWNRFYRADTSRSSEGTGLGLPMARWIAELHGGSIRVESRAGEGSTFFASLPLL